MLKENGATVDYIDIDYIENSVTLYEIIAMAEASSNLARFDGIKYGYSYENPKDLEEMYKKTRQIGFGEEVKRRIMVGSFILSGENAKIYYDKALQIRDDIRKSFLKAFEKYDLILGPTTTSVAHNLSEEQIDPSKSFLDDILVNPVNMAGLPGINVPIGFDEEKMPIGLHIIGNCFDEATIYKLAAYVEKKLNLNLDPKGEE
jgi:aspartyl-tRNA(Asn)/glutamyl-tRNA(Gln) amidotransferase subunit A